MRVVSETLLPFRVVIDTTLTREQVVVEPRIQVSVRKERAARLALLCCLLFYVCYKLQVTVVAVRCRTGTGLDRDDPLAVPVDPIGNLLLTVSVSLNPTLVRAGFQ